MTCDLYSGWCMLGQNKALKFLSHLEKEPVIENYEGCVSKTLSSSHIKKGTWKYDLNPHKYDYDLGFWIKLTDAAAAFCEKTSAGLNQII